MAGDCEQETVREIEYLRQWEFELFKSAITAGQGASRAILLLGGGGAAAMLAFMGPLFRGETTNTSLSVNLCLPLWLFVASALCATANAGLIWVCQVYFRITQQARTENVMKCYRSERNANAYSEYWAYEKIRKRKELILLLVTAGFWVGSFILFVFGAWYAGQAVAV